MIKSYFVLNLLMKDKAYYNNKDRISNNKLKKKSWKIEKERWFALKWGSH